MGILVVDHHLHAFQIQVLANLVGRVPQHQDNLLKRGPPDLIHNVLQNRPTPEGQQLFDPAHARGHTRCQYDAGHPAVPSGMPSCRTAPGHIHPIVDQCRIVQ